MPNDVTVPPIDPFVQTMLQHVRLIAPLPQKLRARVLARAAVVALG